MESEITRVDIFTKEMFCVVRGIGFPVRVILFDDYGDWNTIKDFDKKDLFDVQVDQDDLFTFQYVGLKMNTDLGYLEPDGNYREVENLTIHESITEIL